MLEQWIQNVSLMQIKKISTDVKVFGTYIWRLACAELLRRNGKRSDAA